MPNCQKKQKHIWTLFYTPLKINDFGLHHPKIMLSDIDKNNKTKTIVSNMILRV